MKTKLISLYTFTLLITVAFLYPSCKNDGRLNNKHSGNDTALAIESVNLFYDGEYQESLRELSYLIEEFPDVSELYFWKAKNLVALNQLKEALTVYSTAIEKDSTMAKYHNNRGLVYISLGDNYKALEDFNRSYRIDSSVTQTINNIGLAYSKLGEEYKAIEFYDRVIEIDPLDIYIFNRAVSFINLGEFFKATEDLNSVINMNPKFTRAYLNRGLVLFQINKKEEGCKDLATAIELGSEEAQEYIRYCE